jgi:AcrR family transcriptional regulator
VSRRSPAASTAPTPPAAPVVPLRERFRREVASAIAVAAEEVFAESGLHSAHVGDIAKRAGVAVGTLYNYYEDRDALLAALLRERGDELAATFDAASASVAGKPLKKQLAAFVDAYFSFFVLHRPFFKILFEGELTQLQAAYPRSSAFPSRFGQTLFQALERIFRPALEGRHLRADRPEVYPWLLLGMMRSIAVRDLRKGKPYEAADGVEIVNVFLRGAGA